MRSTRLGQTDIEISRMGFGAMHLAQQDRPFDSQAAQVLAEVFRVGITLVDTADSYCRDDEDRHQNERQVRAAAEIFCGQGAVESEDASRIIIASKGGMLRPRGMWVRFGKPDYLRQAIRESFETLGGTEPITLWQYHQVDRNYPLRESLEAVKQCVDEGLIRHVGLSNVDLPTLQAAQEVLPIVSIQNEYSPWCRQIERNGVLDYCKAEQITMLAWRPLGGRHRAAELSANRELVHMAEQLGATTHQLVLAWLLARSPSVVPIPGTTRVEGVQQIAASVDLSLSPAIIEAIERAIPEETPSLRI